MSLLSQENRLIHTDSPLGKDAIVTTQLQGSEFISDLFNFQANILSDNHNIKQEDLVGKGITFTIYNNGKNNPRYIHGYINQLISHDITEENLRSYSLSVTPGFWFAKLASNNRIFTHKSADAIIKEVLKEYVKHITLKLSLTETYTVRDYCVQFEESDYDFVCRLMSEEGISYYFTHENGNHSLVLCDTNKGFSDCISNEVKYDGGGSLPTEHSIQSWTRSYSYHTAGYELKDYSEFATTSDQKQAVKTVNKLNDSAPYLQRLYGLSHFTAEDDQHKLVDADNKSIVQRHMEAEEKRFDTAQGASDCCEMTAGGLFSINHPISTEKGKYLLTSVHHVISDSNREGTQYLNQFTCIPAKTIHRPHPNSKPKSIVNPQTAEVLEVHATESENSKDLYTQVKVKFPWKNDQNTCWVRVVQNFAGKNWGANFVPRIGQEVVINYLNGDPDRPIVTGAVYNKTNNGPNYTSTQSGFKTQYKDSAFNELRFDDKPAKEEIYMEAGKDHNFLIHNDQTGKIERHQTLEVIENRSITVSKGDETKAIDTGNQTLSLKGDQANTIQGNQTTKVTGDVLIQSPKSIELKVGSSSIKLTPSGIEIKGVKLDAKGDATATVKAGGMLTLKGGITKIN